MRKIRDYTFCFVISSLNMSTNITYDDISVVENWDEEEFDRNLVVAALGYGVSTIHVPNEEIEKLLNQCASYGSNYKNYKGRKIVVNPDLDCIVITTKEF